MQRPTISPLVVETERGPVDAIGAGDRGPLVLLCPGLVGAADDYRGVLPAIAAAGFRAVAYDYQGHYRAALDGRPHTIDRHADDLLAVLAAAGRGEPVHVVGHSLGGFVARTAALRKPAAVRSLALIGCGPQLRGEQIRTSLSRFDEALLARGTGLMWPVISRIIPIGDGERRVFWQRRLAAMQVPFLCGMVRAVLGEPDRGAELSRLAFPRLVMHGARDRRLWPHAEMAEFAATIGAALAVVPESGHSPMLEQPTATSAPLIAFWTEAERLEQAEAERLEQAEAERLEQTEAERLEQTEAERRERAVRLCQEIVRPRPAADPYPIYAALRATAPVMLMEPPGLGPSVFLTRYADCRRMLNDRTCQNLGEVPERLPLGWSDGPVQIAIMRSFALREGPAHLPVRTALGRALSPRRAADYRRDAEEIADRLLDDLARALADDCVVNATSVLAVPFASLTTGRMLGLADDEALRLGELVGATSGAIDATGTPRQRASIEEAGAAVMTALRGRRTGLAGVVHGAGGGLGDVLMLFGAAHDSPASLVSAALRLLLDHPDQADLLRSDPGRGEACVDEVLRLDPPVQITLRAATEPRRFGDVEVPVGAKLHAILAAANRDPAYTDDPDRFLITRTVRGPSLSFGAGRHYCPGAAVARIQAGVLLPRLVRRFPRLRLAGPVRYRAPGTMLRRIADLPVAMEG